MRRSAVLILVFAAACGKPAAAPPVTSSPSPAPVVSGTGTIEGVVRVDSDDIAAVAASAKGFEKYCGNEALDTGLYKVDPATKGLAGAFVEVDGRSEPFALESVPFLDQKACLFTPALIVVPPGPVVFKNSDVMAHNVTIRSAVNPNVSEGFPGGEAISRTLRFDEKIVVRCSIHPWMQAGLVVTRRAAHAVTESKGAFKITGVEAGRRRIRVWHPFGDELEIEADVPKDGTVRVEIPWKPRAGFRAAFGR